MELGDHEQVVVHEDPLTGMQLAIAVHSTVLGPALGGMRICPYRGGLRDAVDDALALASAMTLKASAAGLALGGGKAVMVDDGRMAPGEERRALRLAAAARVIEGLGGAYVTAEDVGSSPSDMDAIARSTRFVVGRSPAAGGGGDPSPFTAAGVHLAMEVALAATTGSPSLEGRRIGILGLGKVGSSLAARLLGAGARVIAYDIDGERVERAAAVGVRPAASGSALLTTRLDVLAPCAVGGLIDDALAASLDCSAVCGAANNQLASRAVAARLARRGILYVPDFMANSGGLVHVAAEWARLEGRTSPPGLDRAAERLEHTLAHARAKGITPLDAAERFALERISAARPRAHAAA